MIATFRNIFAPPRHMILLVAAAWIGLTLAEKRAEHHHLKRDDLNNLIFYSLMAFIIGGRLSFILQNLQVFIQSPLGIISINPDVFDPLGGLAAASITGLIYGQRHQLSLWNSLDALTPLLAILAVGIGLSQLAAGTAFGLPTNLPWAIDLWNAARHPTQIYEILASLLTFGLLWFKRPNPRPGMDFLSFAALTAGWNLFIAAFRADSPLLLNNLNQDQVIAWLILALTFVLIEFRLKTPAKRSGGSANAVSADEN